LVDFGPRFRKAQPHGLPCPIPVEVAQPCRKDSWTPPAYRALLVRRRLLFIGCIRDLVDAPDDNHFSLAQLRGLPDAALTTHRTKTACSVLCHACERDRVPELFTITRIPGEGFKLSRNDRRQGTPLTLLMRQSSASWHIDEMRLQRQALLPVTSDSTPFLSVTLMAVLLGSMRT